MAKKREQLDESNRQEFTVAPAATATENGTDGAAGGGRACAAPFPVKRLTAVNVVVAGMFQTGAGDEGASCARVQAASIQRDQQMRSSVVVNTQGPQSHPPAAAVQRRVGIPHGLIDRLCALENHLHLAPPPGTGPPCQLSVP